jgi:hypothetical protein
MKVVYTSSDGETFSFRLTDDSNLMIPPVAFLSVSDAEFATVWAQGEESRIIILHKFPAFLELLNGTVFAGPVGPDGSLTSVLLTPDEKAIAVRASGTNIGTVVQFKAPSLDLLALLDDFFRRLR